MGIGARGASFVFLVVVGHAVCAQRLHLADKEGYVVGSLSTRERARVARPGRWYHWVSAQEIKRTEGGYHGTLLHGEFSAFHVQGGLREQGRFRQGLKHGTWHYWDVEGRLIRTERWRNGVEDKPGSDARERRNGTAEGDSLAKPEKPKRTFRSLFKKREAKQESDLEEPSRKVGPAKRGRPAPKKESLAKPPRAREKGGAKAPQSGKAP